MAQEKTAIIMMGGGMRSAHGAGFLHTLATELGITHPDIMIGTSGDAGNVAYFSAQQFESLRHVWCDLLSTSKFISLLRFHKMLDVDYLIDHVFKIEEPLNLHHLATSPVRWFVGVTHYETGRPRYIGKVDELDMFEVLRASKALPIFYNRPVFLQGKRYFDGEMGPMLIDHIQKAREEGATRFLIINNTPVHTLFRRTLVNLFAECIDADLAHAIMQDASNTNTCISIPDAQALCVAPRHLPAGVVTRNQEKLRATFAQGASDARAMKDALRALFSVT